MSGSDKFFKRKMKHSKGLESGGEKRAVADTVIPKVFSVKMYQEGIVFSEIRKAEKSKYCLLSLS